MAGMALLSEMQAAFAARTGASSTIPHGGIGLTTEAEVALARVGRRINVSVHATG